MLSLNRLRFHYEHVLRQDLLCKYNYANIFQIPQLSKMLIVAQVSSESVKQVTLAFEIVCGQKIVKTEFSQLRSSRVNKWVSLRAKTKQPTYLVRTCLRAESMYNLIDKLVTLLCFHDFAIQIQANAIQLTIKPILLRLFPEIQNHFELFENAQSVQIILVTSAQTEQETRLLWTGLYQKEVKQYV
uniref:Ribosomal protein L5 n=1 Tax=Zygnema circumcarinatum TaxID=35869 RepID=A0A6N0GXN9_ZYGCR|nr:ribosomal protein L5 [Zygnema circumcarinatum]QKQ14722.1 ribosomal protein L5 [Zygnema circumcarinatum]WEL36366.1 ribosomal protein L5 [Zygnema circumcarinatum]